MLQFWGSLKEKMGKRANKMNFVVPLGGHRFRKIGQKYFGEEEKQTKFQKYPYNVALSRTTVELGNLNVGYIVADPTKPQHTLMLDGTVIEDGLSPEEQDNIAYNGHVKVALRNAIAGNIGMIIVIMALGIGLAVGFMLGQNLPAITQAISGGPTPTPQFGGP